MNNRTDSRGAYIPFFNTDYGTSDLINISQSFPEYLQQRQQRQQTNIPVNPQPAAQPVTPPPAPNLPMFEVHPTDLYTGRKMSGRCNGLLYYQLYERGSDSLYHYTTNVSMIHNHTGNCQSYCLTYACYLLQLVGQTRIEALKAFQLKAAKRLVHLDLNEVYAKYVPEVFGKENIKIEAPYLSTNGSKMVLFLVDTKLVQPPTQKW